MKKDNLRLEKKNNPNNNKSSIDKQSYPKFTWSPFDQPVAKLPDPPANFYFNELFSWMYNGVQTIKHGVYTNRDYIYRHVVFPPEPDNDLIGPAPRSMEYDSIIMEDLCFHNVDDKKNSNESSALLVFLVSILKAVKGQPDKFIKLYAKQRSIIKLLDEDYEYKYQGEQKCIELLIEELNAFLNSENYQLIPPLYHFRGHGIVMSADLSFKNLEKVDIKTEPEFTWEFLFSKQSSDNFTVRLIKILQERKLFIFKLNNTFKKENITKQKNEQDDRIECTLDKEEIKEYFYKLTHKNKAGQQIMLEKDIDYLLCANFKGFEPKTIKKKFNPETKQAYLRHFTYKFYLKYSKTSHVARKYVTFLMDNFIQFDGTQIGTVERNFSKRPRTMPEYLETV